MGHKADPRGLRLGINKNWKSKWFGGREYQKQLKQDIEIREELKQLLKKAGVASIEIERNLGKIRIVIYTNKPGVLIGRGGKELEKVKEGIKKKYFFKEKLEVIIDAIEVKSLEENAQLLADDIAFQLEKRMPFRRVMKSTLGKVMRDRNILGCRLEISGRLGGAEMSRREWLSEGNIPLHTLRINIDFAKSTAYTTYGTLGIKVWIHKKKEEGKNNRR